MKRELKGGKMKKNFILASFVVGILVVSFVSAGFLTGDAIWSSNWCSIWNKCSAGEGDCDGDWQCLPGLICVKDVGAKYGKSATMDVCESLTACKTECSNKEVKCEGAVLKKCYYETNGNCYKFDNGVTCENGCENGACNPAPACSNQCNKVGDKTCEGDVKYTCIADETTGCLEWGTEAVCENGCSNGACNSASITCKDKCSELGATTCEGDYKHICGDYNNDGCLELDRGELCEYGCSNGKCDSAPMTYQGVLDMLNSCAPYLVDENSDLENINCNEICADQEETCVFGLTHSKSSRIGKRLVPCTSTLDKETMLHIDCLCCSAP